MAHNTMVNGSIFQIGGGRTLVNGTAYAIKKGRTLVGGTGYDISFGTPISSLGVGNTVNIRVDGVLKEFIVVHKGLPSSFYNTSCNGIWLLMKDIYEERQWYNDESVFDPDDASNNYSDSGIHQYLNADFLNLFDAGIKAKIKQVKIPYHTGRSGSDKTGANGLSCKIFLLEGVEVGLSDRYTMPTDRTTLSYFSDSGNTDANRIAYLNGVATDWALRSPVTSNSGVWRVASNGAEGTFDIDVYTSRGERGIRPAFIVSSDTLIDPDTFEIL